eukprot:360121-Chlamydomonas_euryale.AAC.10
MQFDDVGGVGGTVPTRRFSPGRRLWAPCQGPCLGSMTRASAPRGCGVAWQAGGARARGGGLRCGARAATYAGAAAGARIARERPAVCHCHPALAHPRAHHVLSHGCGGQRRRRKDGQRGGRDTCRAPGVPAVRRAAMRMRVAPGAVLQGPDAACRPHPFPAPPPHRPRQHHPQGQA